MARSAATAETKLDGSSSHIATLPDEILLLIFSALQADAFRWHRGVSSVSRYRDLLACNVVCRYWTHLVPKILYRDVRISNHYVFSPGSTKGISVLEVFHASLFFDTLNRNLRNLVTVITLDVFSDALLGFGNAFSTIGLCRHLRAISLHVRRGGSSATPAVPMLLSNPAVTELSELKGLKHFRLGGESYDMGPLLLELLGIWPHLTHLDVMECDWLFLPNDARLALVPRLQHLRARSAHVALARLLNGQSELRTATWRVSSDVDFSEATYGMELLFLHVRTLHLVFETSETIVSGDIAAVLCQLSSLRTLVLGPAMDWDADDVAHAIPQWVEEIGIVFTAGLCIPPAVLAAVLRQALVQVKSLSVYVPVGNERGTWWSAPQTAYCQKLTQLCGIPVKEWPQSELDFLDLNF